MENTPISVKVEVKESTVLSYRSVYLSVLRNSTDDRILRNCLSGLLTKSGGIEYYIEYILSTYINQQKFLECVTFKTYLDISKIQLRGRLLTNLLVSAYLDPKGKPCAKLIKSWGATLTIDAMRLLLLQNVVVEDFYSLDLSKVQIFESLAKTTKNDRYNTSNDYLMVIDDTILYDDDDDDTIHQEIDMSLVKEEVIVPLPEVTNDDKQKVIPEQATTKQHIVSPVETTTIDDKQKVIPEQVKEIITDDLLPKQVMDDDDKQKIIPEQVKEITTDDLLLKQVMDDDDKQKIIPEQVKEITTDDLLPKQVMDDDDKQKIIPEQVKEITTDDLLPKQVMDDDKQKVIPEQVKEITIKQHIVSTEIVPTKTTVSTPVNLDTFSGQCRLRSFNRGSQNLVTNRCLKSIEFLYRKMEEKYKHDLPEFIDILVRNILISETPGIIENILSYQPNNLVISRIINNITDMGGVRLDIIKELGMNRLDIFLLGIGYRGITDLAILYASKEINDGHLIIIGALIGNKLDVVNVLLDGKLYNSNVCDILAIAIKYDRISVIEKIKDVVPDIDNIWDTLYSLSSSSNKSLSILRKWNNDSYRFSTYFRYITSGSINQILISNIEKYETLIRIYTEPRNKNIWISEGR